MNIGPRDQLNVTLNWLRLLLRLLWAFTCAHSWTLLMIIQSREYLRMLTLMVLWRPREHDRLTSSIFGWWDSWSRSWNIIFENASYQLLTLITLEVGDLGLIWSSRRDNGLTRILRAHIIVLKAIPTLSASPLWGVFITLCAILSLILLAIWPHR